MIEKLDWDDNRKPDRGKVLHSEDLAKIDKFYRYLDVDGDGIPYRTIPGEDPKGSFFTRGSGHTKFGAYTEDSAAYMDVLERIAQKWRNAADFVPKPVVRKASKPTPLAILSLGGCDGAVQEAIARLNKDGIELDYLRVRAFPFHHSVEDFIAEHETVFVVEQNRDAQLRGLLINETSAEKKRIKSVLDWGGMPTDPRIICKAVRDHIAEGAS